MSTEPVATLEELFAGLEELLPLVGGGGGAPAEPGLWLSLFADSTRAMVMRLSLEAFTWLRDHADDPDDLRVRVFLSHDQDRLVLVPGTPEHRANRVTENVRLLRASALGRRLRLPPRAVRIPLTELTDGTTSALAGVPPPELREVREDIRHG